jgi:hypothetical protein
MRKGPVPVKAVGIALPAALARGFVILCQRNQTSEIDLVIAGPGRTAIVCICRTKQLNETPDVMEAQFRIIIAALRRVPLCPGRCCEIWACDYYGNIRFFRLTDSSFVEIGRDGNSLNGAA